MYIWDEEHQKAYVVERGEAGEPLPATVEIQLKNNNFSYIMDFDYYRECGLLTDEMILAIAQFQHDAVAKYELVKNKTTEMSTKLSELDSFVGVIDFMKLAVSETGFTDDNYLKLTLNTTEYENGIIYRTDADSLEKDKFKLRTTSKLDTNGDPIDNPAASYLYIIKPGDQPAWVCAYLKEKIDITDPNNTDPEHPNQLVFWIQDPIGLTLKEPYNQYEFYLLKQNNIDGYLGALQAADEAAVTSLDTSTRLITQPHPTYFEKTSPRMYQEISNVNTNYTAQLSNQELAALNGYGWYWCSSGNAADGTRFYFCFSDEGDKCWQKVYFTDQINTPELQAAIEIDKAGAQALSYPWRPYWFNLKTSKLYRLVSGFWVELTTTTERRITALFNTVYRTCWTRTQYLNGLYQRYKYTHHGDTLPVGNYYMESPYPTFWSFTTTKPLNDGDTLVYSTDDGWVTQTTTENGEPTSEELKAKGFRFDNVFYHPWNNLDGIQWEDGSICETTVANDKTQQAGYTMDATGMLRTRGYVSVYPDTEYTITGLLTDAKIHFYNENKVWIKCIDTADQNEPCVISKENQSVVFKTYGSISYGASAHTTWGSKEEYIAYMHNSDEYKNEQDSDQRAVLDAKYEENWNAYTMQTSDANAQTQLIDGVEPVYYIKIARPVPNIATESGQEPADPPEITMQANNYHTAVIMSGVTYERLGASSTYERDGDVKGIIASVEKFYTLADYIYSTLTPAIRQAKQDLKDTESTLANQLGDIYREGYWQDTNYIDGDEMKLYNDATDNLKKIAKPEAKYEIKFLDLYSSNHDVYGDDEGFISTDIEWPDISISSAVHLVDPEIDINTWAFIDKLKKCYDQAKKTSLTINTNLSTIGQHSFDDVMSHIAEVASEFKGKQTKYDAYGTARVSGSNIVAATVTGSAIAPSTITGQNIVNNTITVDKIYNFEDEIISAVKGYFGTAHINTAEIKNLATEVANMALANIDQANIDAANIGNLTTYVANIVQANVDSLMANSVIANKIETILIHSEQGEFENAKAAVAQIAYARINDALVDTMNVDQLRTTVADIAEARIRSATIVWNKSQVADVTTLFAENAMADKFYIKGLMVQDATIASLTVGDLVIQRPTQDGGIEYVKISIGDLKDKDGNYQIDPETNQRIQGIVYEPVDNLTGNNIAQNTITGGVSGNIAQNTITGANIVANSIVADNLAVNDIFAENTQTMQLIAQNIDADTITANAGNLGELITNHINANKGAGLDLSSNVSITQTVKSNVQSEVEALDLPTQIMTTVSDEMQNAAPAVVEIESTNGNIFRSNTASTQLKALIYWNGMEIKDYNQLNQYFRSKAPQLRWYFRKPGQDQWTMLDTDDNKISDDGFTLNIDTSTVKSQLVCKCELVFAST